MFSTPAKQSDASFGMDPTPNVSAVATRSSSATIIARGVRVEGEFRSQGDVVIEGEVQGSISAAGVLTVGSEAKIKADISVDEAKISGVIEGNLQISKQAIFYSSAKITGDITAERITVEAGAQLDGRIKVGGTPIIKTELEVKETSKIEQKVESKSVSSSKEQANDLPPIIRPTV
jgi:cytoskeletal protein CcmA (bactofilin family)